MDLTGRKFAKSNTSANHRNWVNLTG